MPVKRFWSQWIFSLLLIFSHQHSHAAVTEWVDIDTSRGWIEFPVHIKGSKAIAIYDTGANIQVINQEFVKNANIDLPILPNKVSIQGTHKVKELPIYSLVPINLFGIEMKLRDVPALQPQDSKTNKFPDLILGASFFGDLITQIDYPNQRMRLLTRDAINLKKIKNIKVKKGNIGESPQVKVKFNDNKPIWLTFDTGNAGAIHLSQRLVHRYKLTQDKKIYPTFSHGINTTEKMKTFNLDKLKFGPFELDNSLVTVSAGSESRLFKNDKRDPRRIQLKENGLIGYDVFKHFIITYDYRKSHMHIGLPETIQASQ